MIKTSVVTIDDNLVVLVDEINAASWDDANEMVAYDVPSLKAYLERENTLFVKGRRRDHHATPIRTGGRGRVQEVWLGTEVENYAANALYRSLEPDLEPDDEANFVGYTYEIGD